MKFSLGSRKGGQCIIFEGISITLVALLIIFTVVLEGNRIDLEKKWLKLDSKIGHVEYFRANSYDQRRKFNLENRDLFERIVTDSIKIYTTNTTNSYNDRITENIEKNTDLLDEKFNQTFKRDSPIIRSLPILKEITVENITIVPGKYKKNLTIETFRVYNEEFSSVKLDTVPLLKVTIPRYGVIFRFLGFFGYGYVSEKNFSTSSELIDSQWILQ